MRTQKRYKQNNRNLLYIVFLLSCLSNSALFGQIVTANKNKTQVIITDEKDGRVTIIDTIFPPRTNIDFALKQMGYRQDGSYSTEELKGGRKVKIQIRELSNSLMLSEKADGQLNMDVRKFFDLPPNAIVEDLPDGRKRILMKKKDAFGKEYTQEAKVRFGRMPVDGTKETSWEEVKGSVGMVPSVPPSISKDVELKDYKHNSVYETTGSPRIKLTFAPLDKFDKSSLVMRMPELKDAKEMPLINLDISPDYDKAQFEFSFYIPEAASTEFLILDVLGSVVYNENLGNFSGRYNKFLPGFSIYKEGTFLLLIKRQGEMFTQKFEIH